MSEKNSNCLGWLHGLEDYFEFTGDENSRQYVKFILKLLYNHDPMITVSDNGSMKEFIFTLRKFVSNPVVEMIQKYYRDETQDHKALEDAYSRSQVNSKIWLAKELAKIKKEFTNIHVLAGWFGQLIHYLDAAGITYERARIIDMDINACEVSDTIFNLDKLNDFKAKAVNTDIDSLDLTATGITCTIKTNQSSYEEKLASQLIINTSAEHMTDEWFFKIKFKEMVSDPILVIQSNNLFDVPEHINCVHSVDHMKKKFPMREILFEGELQLKGYKRVMLIGRP
jgi:hypothetical protein